MEFFYTVDFFRYNAADYWMELLISNDEIDEDLERNESQQLNVEEYLEDQEVPFDDKKQGENYEQGGQLSSSFKSSIDSVDDITSSFKSVTEIRRSFNKLLCSSFTDLTRNSPIADLENIELALLNTPRVKLIKAWKNKEDTVRSCNRISINSNFEEKDTVYNEEKYATSWWNQFTILSSRSLKISSLEMSSCSNNMKIIAAALVVGMLWFQLDNTEKDFPDRASYLFFTLAYWILGNMFQSVGKFPIEKKVIDKVYQKLTFILFKPDSFINVCL